MTDCLTDLLTDWLTKWLAVWLTDWRTLCLTDWLTDWLTDRPTDRPTKWLINPTHLISTVFGGVILDTYRSFSVNNGDSLILWCTDRDLRTLQGQVSLTWVKDDVQIPNNDPRLNTVANGTLSLQQIRKIDEGEYTCTLTADGFLSTNTTRFFVIGELILLVTVLLT